MSDERGMSIDDDDGLPLHPDSDVVVAKMSTRNVMEAADNTDY